MCGISQEMSMMQLSSEQTSLSNSLETDIESEQRSVAACNEDPDAILIGKKKIDNLSIGEESLSYWDSLKKSQTSSVQDLLGRDCLEEVDSSEVLCKPKPKKPNLRPWIAFNDLNNSDDAPYENKPKPSIEIGIAFDF